VAEHPALEAAAVTRIEVVDAGGRAFVRQYAEPGAVVDVQDEGRTLKVFAGELVDGPAAWNPVSVEEPSA